MNKSDLKDGMILIYRNGCEVDYYKGYLLDFESEGIEKMNLFNDDLTHKEHEFWDVCKIIEDDSVIWEREEIDWSKVPVGTKVMVKFNFDDEYQEGTFICINDNGKFLTYDKRAGILHWKYCKLAEEQKEEVTIDDINEDIVRYCHKNSDDCNRLCGLCTTKYILNNYNITRK